MGSSMFTRPPDRRALKSDTGFSPQSDSLNPPLPFRFPWHALALQPAFDSTAITSREKLVSSATRTWEATKNNVKKLAILTCKTPISYDGKGTPSSSIRFLHLIAT